MRDPRQKLDSIIESYLNALLTFEEFQRAYSKCYADDEADANFRPDEVDHYGSVHEKAEWTVAAPTAEDRGYGYLNPSEFRAWLAIHESHKPPMDG
jgi:hypothetical protein